MPDEKSPIYNFDVVCNQKATDSYLDSLKENKGIQNSTVSEVREQTWEDSYPNPLERLLAIEAIEYKELPSTIETDDPNIKPDHIKGYPYRLHVDYLIEFNIGTDDYYREWYFDNSQLPDENDEGVSKITPYYYWYIDDPTYKLLVNLSIQPIMPIESIVLTAIIDKGKCWFEPAGS